MTTTYTAIFKDYTATRRTENEYAFATRKNGKVVFHTTIDAARRRGGEVAKVVEHMTGRTEPRPAAKPVVEFAAAPTGCTVVVAAGGERCGKPVVKVIVSNAGHTFGECAAHVI